MGRHDHDADLRDEARRQAPVDARGQQQAESGREDDLPAAGAAPHRRLHRGVQALHRHAASFSRSAPQGV